MDPPPLCLFCNTKKMNSANTTISVCTKCNITILHGNCQSLQNYPIKTYIGPPPFNDRYETQKNNAFSLFNYFCF